VKPAYYAVVIRPNGTIKVLDRRGNALSAYNQANNQIAKGNFPVNSEVTVVEATTKADAERIAEENRKAGLYAR